MRVFISSTSEDLKAYRSVVEQVILDAGWAPVGMEHFSADPRGIVKRCQDEVSGCDLMILIQAFRRGWVPEPEQGGDGITSATAWEVRAADQRDPKIPVLVFLADDSWPRGLSDLDPQAVEWIDSFRGGLNRSAKFFKYEDGALPQFRALVREQLAIYRAPIAESREDASGVAATKRASRRRVVHPERSGQFANQPEDTGKGQPTRIAVAILWLFFAVCQLPALFGAQPFGYAEVFMLTALPTAIVTTWRL